MNFDDLNIGTFTPEFVEKISKLDGLQDVTMNNCAITSLHNFPTKLCLLRLELNDNKLKGGELKHLEGLQVLATHAGFTDSVTDG
jgi:hypothetical protein